MCLCMIQFCHNVWYFCLCDCLCGHLLMLWSLCNICSHPSGSDSTWYWVQCTILWILLHLNFSLPVCCYYWDLLGEVMFEVGRGLCLWVGDEVMLRYILEAAPPLHTFCWDRCLQNCIKACMKFMLGAHSEYPYHFLVKTVLFWTRINDDSSALV